MPDMSLAQFHQALARHGMTSEGIMGYVRMNIPGHYHVSVSYYNAPRQTWRARLAFLLSERDRMVTTEANKEVTARVKQTGQNAATRSAACVASTTAIPPRTT
jgi:hypothetical protein